MTKKLWSIAFIALAAMIGITVFCLARATQADDCAVLENIATKQVNPKAIPKDKVKVGVLYISDPAEGAGYTYTHDLGILAMQQNLGLRDNQIVIKKNIGDTDTVAIGQAIEECVASGCQIIFATSFGYMDMMEKAAEKYPEVYFSHGTGYKSNGKNFNNYFGRIYQPRYLSGIVAGMKTQSNQIGYIAAMDKSNSEVTGGIDAFALGVYSVNPNAKVYVKVTNSWFDPAREKAATQELLAMGCDVLSQHCDTAYPLELAEQKGVWGIGYNSDMRKQTPEAALVSVIWNWGAYYTTSVQNVIDGTWDGSNYYGGMQEGMVGITELSTVNSKAAQEKVEQATEAILNGSLPIFAGEIETNTGTVIGTKGKVFDDAEITGGIHWYFKNVVLIE